MSRPGPAAAGRIAPRVGDAVVIRRGLTHTPATITEVAGRTISVRSESEELVFELHPLTAQFVLASGPSYGTRLLLTGVPAEAG